MFSRNRLFRKRYYIRMYRKFAKLLDDYYIVYVIGIETIAIRAR